MFYEVKEDNIWKEMTKEIIFMFEEHEKKYSNNIWSIQWTE